MSIIDKKPCGECAKHQNDKTCEDCPEYKEWGIKVKELIIAAIPRLDEYYCGRDEEGNAEWDYKELAEDILGILEES